MESIDIENTTVAPPVLEVIPKFIAEKLCIFPFDLSDGRLLIAVASEELVTELKEFFSVFVSQEVEFFLAPAETIRKAIIRNYPESEVESDDDLSTREFVSSMLDFTDEDLSSDQSDDRGAIAILVRLILKEAVHVQASSIHVEPCRTRVRLRFQLKDGMIERDSPPLQLLSPMRRRLEYLAGCKSSEKPTIRGANIEEQIDGKGIHLKVNLLPTVHGETVVLTFVDSPERCNE